MQCLVLDGKTLTCFHLKFLCLNILQYSINRWPFMQAAIHEILHPILSFPISIFIVTQSVY